jgi:hypothetical protein
MCARVCVVCVTGPKQRKVSASVAKAETANNERRKKYRHEIVNGLRQKGTRSSPMVVAEKCSECFVLCVVHPAITRQMAEKAGVDVDLFWPADRPSPQQLNTSHPGFQSIALMHQLLGAVMGLPNAGLPDRLHDVPV